jgi:hypothetical protein
MGVGTDVDATWIGERVGSGTEEGSRLRFRGEGRPSMGKDAHDVQLMVANLSCVFLSPDERMTVQQSDALTKRLMMTVSGEICCRCGLLRSD